MNIRYIIRSTLLGRLIMIPARAIKIAGPYIMRQIWLVIKWAFISKEYYNHSATLTAINSQYLASFVATVTKKSIEEIEGYQKELLNNHVLRQDLLHLALLNRRKHAGDITPRYGRRIGWYSFIRTTKPRVVIETGIDAGLGTAIICAALRRNREEGFEGHLYATDLYADNGYLVPAYLREFYTPLTGDSVASLEKWEDKQIDIFIHDSDCHALYELSEYTTIKRFLHKGSFVLSDNARACSSLRQFSKRLCGQFSFFQDELFNHWWMGEGIGVAFDFEAVCKKCNNKVVTAGSEYCYECFDKIIIKERWTASGYVTI